MDVTAGNRTEADIAYRYYHDQANQTVYAVEDPPMVSRGRHNDLFVSTHIEITRADNRLIGPGRNRWFHPVAQNPQEVYDGRKDSQTKAVGFFWVQHRPNLPEIDKETYQVLRGQYEAAARRNSE